MPYLGSINVAHIHALAEIVSSHPPFLTTGDPTYSSPLLPRIVVMSLDKETTYYSYAGWTPTTTNGVIYCNVGLSLSNHGTFEFQVDDSTKTLDSATLRNGARVYIYLGKTEPTRVTMLSGMIRQTGYSRGCNDNLIYNVAGFGTGIRFNERILDITLDPPVTDDGTTIDTSDDEFFADQVIDDSVDDTDYYPKGTANTHVEGTGGYEYIDTSNTQGDSPIQDFIPGVNLRFGEIDDLHQQIENYTGGRVYVDPQDKLQFQPVKTPLSANTGFVITTNYQPTIDPADTTMYVLSDDYTYTDSISKDAGYSNSLFGILPASVVPDKDTNSDLTNYYQNKDVEIAMRFRPITNPNWRIFATVEGVGLTNIQNENTVRGRFRICADDNGVPKNTGGIIANRYIYPNEFYSTTESPVQTVEVFGRGSNDLDENSYYWLILSSVNATATEYWRWYKDDVSSSSTAYTATASTGTSSASDGGTGWTINNTKMAMIQTRFKAEPYNILDHQGVHNRILIESVTPSFPQQITSKMGATKYLLGLVNNSNRPRRVYDFPSLTVPNKPPMPGDVCVLIDSRFSFSTSGNICRAGQITDLNYSMGIKNGGSSPSSIGLTSLSMSVIAYPHAY